MIFAKVRLMKGISTSLYASGNVEFGVDLISFFFPVFVLF